MAQGLRLAPIAQGWRLAPLVQGWRLAPLARGHPSDLRGGRRQEQQGLERLVQRWQEQGQRAAVQHCHRPEQLRVFAVPCWALPVPAGCPVRVCLHQGGETSGQRDYGTQLRPLSYQTTRTPCLPVC